MEGRDKKEQQIILVLTHKCNLSCRYCYEKNRDGESMSLDTAKEIITRFLSDPGIRNVDIVLFGGEPFLEFDLIKNICEWTWSKSWSTEYQFDFSTNGTAFSKESKQWLKENAYRIKLTLSADGTKETHNFNRDNSFDRVDFDLFRELWNPSFVKMTIGRETLGNLASDLVFFHEAGFLFTDCNLAEGISWTDKDAELFAQELEKISKYYEIHIDTPLPPLLDLELWKCSVENRDDRKCEAGCGLLAFDCDGTQYPCNYFTSMSFSASDMKRIKEMFDGKHRLTHRDCYEHCYYYPICNSCYASDYSLCGEFGKHNESRCIMVKTQAHYAALIQGQRISQVNADRLSGEEKAKMFLTIKAIKNILKGGGTNE